MYHLNITEAFKKICQETQPSEKRKSGRFNQNFRHFNGAIKTFIFKVSH